MCELCKARIESWPEDALEDDILLALFETKEGTASLCRIVEDLSAGTPFDTTSIDQDPQIDAWLAARIGRACVVLQAQGLIETVDSRGLWMFRLTPLADRVLQ